MGNCWMRRSTGDVIYDDQFMLCGDAYGEVNALCSRCQNWIVVQATQLQTLLEALSEHRCPLATVLATGSVSGYKALADTSGTE